MIVDSNCSYHMTVNILTSCCQLWTFLDLCVSYLPFKSQPVVSYFESLQVQDQVRFHKESEKTFHKECEMRGPSNPTKASRTHSWKNLTPAKSRIPCQIQEGTKVEKGKLCCVLCVVDCGTEIMTCLLVKSIYFFNNKFSVIISRRIKQFDIIFYHYFWTKLSCNMYRAQVLHFSLLSQWLVIALNSLLKCSHLLLNKWQACGSKKWAIWKILTCWNLGALMSASNLPNIFLFYDGVWRFQMCKCRAVHN